MDENSILVSNYVRIVKIFNFLSNYSVKGAPAVGFVPIIPKFTLFAVFTRKFKRAERCGANSSVPVYRRQINFTTGDYLAS